MKKIKLIIFLLCFSALAGYSQLQDPTYTKSDFLQITQLESFFAYGVSWDNSLTTTTCQRIGNPQLHEDLPIQSNIRRCVLNDDGTVNYYLLDTCSYWKDPVSDTLIPLVASVTTLATINSQDTLGITGAFTGNESYYKGRYFYNVDSNKYARIESKISDNALTFSADTNVWISHTCAIGDSIVICNARLDGIDGNVMVELPEYFYKFVVSGTTRQVWLSQLPLAGYEKIEKSYISAYEAYKDADTLKSVSGEFPTTSQTIVTFRTAAAQNGSHWSQQRLDVYTPLFWLYLVEYSDFNAQSALSVGITDGVSADWSAYNAYNPVHRTGLSNRLGNASGEVTLILTNFNSTTYTTQSAVYRGIENIYGHIWKFMDGLNNFNSSALGSQAWVCLKAADFASDTRVGYTLVGNMSETDGYIKTLLPKTVLPITVGGGGGSATYKSDYHYSYFDNDPDIGWRVAHWSGALNTSAGGGWLGSVFYHSTSVVSASTGARLCLKNTE